ncbi:hypothetical protein [Clostridium sartagoforme]|nr:hypothetical protein [Clostridium sartagoforme]
MQKHDNNSLVAIKYLALNSYLDGTAVASTPKCEFKGSTYKI